MKCYDFRTADNANQPHIAIFSTLSDETVAIVPIKASIAVAEAVAEVIVEALEQWK